MNTHLTGLGRSIAAFGAAAAIVLVPLAGTASASVHPAPAIENIAPAAAADGTPEGAVQWFKDHQGDSSKEHYCEQAVENAYGTTGIWPSAIAHWNGAIKVGKAHKGDKNPPLGAFVYWNTSQYGHVGISDGKGGFYSTSVDGAIGHGSSLSYFGSYLGWSDPQVPA